MIKIVMAWLVVFAIFAGLLWVGGNSDKENCNRIGRELDANSVLIGSRCMVEGYGRFN